MSTPISNSDIRHVVIIGNFPPRQCGIATFTSDLRDALITADPNVRVSTVAMTDPGQSYAYPEAVGYEIAQNNLGDYIAAAAHINALNPDVVLLQHEFGIFGGKAGEYLLELTARLRAPLVTTLHTVLTEPTSDQRRVLNKLTEHSTRLVVMAETGRRLLAEHWNITCGKVAVIPHGIPDAPFLDPAFHKNAFELDGRRIILTFGLLSPNKGIENMIAALPEIVRENPDVLYVVLGATHPHLIATAGEAYRQQLIAQAEEIGVASHVRFINEFVDPEILKAWLSAADVYVTPYLNEQQITSGTLAYAVGLGKAVISTPYWHAKELLANGVGVLVPFSDASALATTVNDLLADNARRDRMRSRAYKVGRGMVWAEVGRTYIDLLAQARMAGVTRSRVLRVPFNSSPLPQSNLAAVSRMTDGCGMLQHSRSSVSDRRHGYCLDDNARALMLSVSLEAEGIETMRARHIIDACASFVDHAWDEERGAFRNFMDYSRNWLEERGSDDSHGRAVWALGRVASDTHDHALKLWATGLIDSVIPTLATLRSPRAMAFAILGLNSYLSIYPGHRAASQVLEAFAECIHLQLKRERRPGWNWFESVLAYDNARLPEALISAGTRLQRPEMTSDAIVALQWLMEVQTGETGQFRAVGTESFGRAYERPLKFDQQPVEAWATIDACAAANTVTADSSWVRHAQAAFDWFMGRNDLGLRMATPNGGCYDGLQVDRVNLNQGAESILALQFSIAGMRLLQRGRNDNEEPLAAAG